MFKKTLLAVLMGACSLAQAQYYKVTGTYTGLADYETRVFDSNRTIEVSALVYDVNGDNQFTIDEVREFHSPYLSIDSFRMEYYGRCGYADGSSWCLNAFSYTGGNALTFEAYQSYWDFDAHSTAHVVSGSHAYTSFQFTDGEGHTSYTGVRWTPETRFSVTVAPAVPEPSTYAMLGAGLGAIALMARRRPKQ